MKKACLIAFVVLLLAGNVYAGGDGETESPANTQRATTNEMTTSDAQAEAIEQIAEFAQAMGLRSEFGSSTPSRLKLRIEAF